MKFAIDRKDAAAAIDAVHGAVMKRVTIPILGSVLLDASDGMLTVVGGDLEQQITYVSPSVRIERPGRTTISAHKLHDVIRSMPEGAELSFSQADQRVTISAGATRFGLPFLDASQFPRLADEGLTAGFTIDAKTLKRLFDAGGFAYSSGKTRYYLNCAFMHTPGPGKLRIASCDGKRLAYCDAPVSGFDYERGASIDPASAALAVKLLGNVAPDADVTVDVAPNLIRLGIGQATLIAKLLDSAGLPYKNAIPAGRRQAVTVDTDLIMGAVDRAMIMMDRQIHRVLLSLTRDLIDVRGADVLEGEASDQVACEYRGPDLTIALDGRWLREMLGYVRTENTIIELADDTSPVSILETGESDWYSLLMPQAPNRRTPAPPAEGTVE